MLILRSHTVQEIRRNFVLPHTRAPAGEFSPKKPVLINEHTEKNQKHKVHL
jgi:hypothetical protein